MLDVTLLGGASFSINCTIVKSDLGPAGRLLACYLFEFAGRVHRRERLADIFWRDSDPDKSRPALNTAIWRIRKMLNLASKGTARHLVTVGDDVILEESQSIRVDTHRLESVSKRLLNRIGNDGPVERDIEDVNAVLGAYVGPFLDGYDDDWVLQERERLHCLFVRSISSLMRTAAKQGQYESALDYGRKILMMDALRESVQRDLMLLLVLNGQRAEAIRAYQRFSGLLQSELALKPMPETKRLHDEIFSGEIFGRIHEYASAQFGIQAN
jgi:DNA-binding SARP family transcriptional activator